MSLILNANVAVKLQNDKIEFKYFSKTYLVNKYSNFLIITFAVKTQNDKIKFKIVISIFKIVIL